MKKVNPLGYIIAVVGLTIACIILMIGVVAVSESNKKLNKILDTACMATRSEYALCKAGVEVLKSADLDELNTYYQMYK